MNSKQLFQWVGLTQLILILLFGCKGDDNAPVIEEPQDTITVNDVSVDIDENPELGSWVTTVTARTRVDFNITYRIIDQSVEGATIIDATTGALVVFTTSAFDFETNPEIIVEVEASVPNLRDTAQVIIQVNDVLEFTDGFITTWRTTVANEEIFIPIRSSTYDYNFSIDWGDGSKIEEDLTERPSHVYQSPSIYTVKIIGQFPSILMRGARSGENLITVEQWGTIEWENMESAFHGCSNLKVTAEDSPDLTRVTSMKEMFATATSLRGDLSRWEVNTIEDMSYLFWGCQDFNSDLGLWDVSNVQSMNKMFLGAESFNGSLSNWDVSKVRDMEQMFGAATVFNQDLNNWNVGSVTNMSGLFSGAESFDGDLSSWNVSSVTNMGSMFRGARAFSGDVSQWNVTNVTSMGFMFNGAFLFDVDLGSWDIRSVGRMNFMLNLSGLSIDNYDATLDGWSNLSNPPLNIVLGASNLEYCEKGESARNLLINNYNWTINDDEKASDCP